MREILVTTTVTIVGLMVGVELCVALFVNPIFDRLPGDDGLLGRSDGARVLGRVMPFWYSTSIVLSVALAVAGGGRAWALSTGAALFVLSIIMSIVFLVPINNRAKEWSTSTAPGDWREQLHAWDRFHYVRLAVIAGGLVLIVFGSTRG